MHHNSQRDSYRDLQTSETLCFWGFLLAPFICLDGMNEKGVSIAVLTLDSKPVHHHSGKPTIATTLAIRLVLDKAATTEEAVALLRGYDMFASSGRDYHFYITDANGDDIAVLLIHYKKGAHYELEINDFTSNERK